MRTGLILSALLWELIAIAFAACGQTGIGSVALAMSAAIILAVLAPLAVGVMTSARSLCVSPRRAAVPPRCEEQPAVIGSL
jgi:hypothetical protein